MTYSRKEVLLRSTQSRNGLKLMLKVRDGESRCVNPDCYAKCKSRRTLRKEFSRVSSTSIEGGTCGGAPCNATQCESSHLALIRMSCFPPFSPGCEKKRSRGMLYAPLLLLVVGHPVPCTAGGEASAGKGINSLSIRPQTYRAADPLWG